LNNNFLNGKFECKQSILLVEYGGLPRTFNEENILFKIYLACNKKLMQNNNLSNS